MSVRLGMMCAELLHARHLLTHSPQLPIDSEKRCRVIRILGYAIRVVRASGGFKPFSKEEQKLSILVNVYITHRIEGYIRQYTRSATRQLLCTFFSVNKTNNQTNRQNKTTQIYRPKLTYCL